MKKQINELKKKIKAARSVKGFGIWTDSEIDAKIADFEERLRELSGGN